MAIPIKEYSVEDLKLYQREWEVVINTQMHFNDLIIRYRNIFLTIFLSIITVSFSLYSYGKIEPATFYCIVVAILLSWALAFLLDYFYYYQMLLAAVAHAKKFDDNEKFKELGLFGLTKEISDRVTQCKASTFIFIFYGVPAALTIIGVIIVH